MDTRKILSAIGTFAVVGAVSTAGAALWTKVLNRKFQMVQLKLTHPKSDKIIFVDFKNAKRGRCVSGSSLFHPHKRPSPLWRQNFLGGNQG